MARFALLAALLTFTLPLFATALAPRSQPSGTPSCYACPGQDEGGFPLGTGNGDVNNNGNTIFCSYPAVPGEDPDDFFCEYSNANGALTDDHDAGLCPGSAASASCNTRRNNNFEAMKRRNEARAARPRAAIPAHLAARSALGKKKRTMH